MEVSRREPPPFVPAGRLARALVLALGANAAMAWIVVLGVATFFARVWNELGERVVGQSLAAHWSQIETARRVQGLVWIVTAVLFLMWLSRVYGNLAALGAERLRFSPRWAVSMFFVPGVNLIWPFLVMRELWWASDPDAPDSPQPPPGVGSSWLAWWWGLFVLASLLDPGFWRLMEDSTARFGSSSGQAMLTVLAQLIETAAAVLGIVVVRGIDERQATAFGVETRR